MAWQLVVETLDHAPRDLAPPERFLLVILAEYIKDTRTRECEQSTEDLAYRMGVTADGVRKILGKLAKYRNLDVRVPIGRDKHGNPVYAHRGKVPRFRLPTFEAPPGCPCRACHEANKGGTDGTPSGAEGGTPVVKGGTPVVEGGTDGPERPDTRPAPPVSGGPVLRSPRAHVSEAARLAEEVGATEEEINALVEKITADHPNVAQPVAYLRGYRKNGQLADMLAEARAAQQRTRIAAEIDHARLDRRQECEHGTPGGLYRRPDTGRSATCPQCRAAERTEVPSDAA